MAVLFFYYGYLNSSYSLQDIKSLVQYALDNFKADGCVNVRAEFPKKQITTNGEDCQIWKYTGNKFGSTEWVAYFQEEKGIAIFVMTSNGIKEFEKAQQVFLERVCSYNHLSGKVIIREK